VLPSVARGGDHGVEQTARGCGRRQWPGAQPGPPGLLLQAVRFAMGGLMSFFFANVLMSLLQLFTSGFPMFCSLRRLCLLFSLLRFGRRRGDE
jgi:hypothetical protein